MPRSIRDCAMDEEILLLHEHSRMARERARAACRRSAALLIRIERDGEERAKRLAASVDLRRQLRA